MCTAAALMPPNWVANTSSAITAVAAFGRSRPMLPDRPRLPTSAICQPAVAIMAWLHLAWITTAKSTWSRWAPMVRFTSSSVPARISRRRRLFFPKRGHSAIYRIWCPLPVSFRMRSTPHSGRTVRLKPAGWPCPTTALPIPPMSKSPLRPPMNGRSRTEQSSLNILNSRSTKPMPAFESAWRLACSCALPMAQSMDSPTNGGPTKAKPTCSTAR